MEVRPYLQLLEIIAVKPSLASLKVGDKVPADWPLVFVGQVAGKDSQAMMAISDTKTTLNARVSDQNMMHKLESLEPGQVIFLYDSSVQADQDQSIYLTVDKLYTLKEVSDYKPQKEQVLKERAGLKADKPSQPERKKVTIPRQARKKDELDSNWRTLAERWEKQGKSWDK